KWPKEAVDFLIIENDPAQRFKFFVFVLWFEPAATPGEVSKNHAGLGELFLAVNQHGHLTHFANFRAKFRCALSHGPKEINPNWRPIRSNQVEHQRGAIGVARLSEAIKLIFRHKSSSQLLFYRANVTGTPAVDRPSKWLPASFNSASGRFSCPVIVRTP